MDGQTGSVVLRIREAETRSRYRSVFKPVAEPLARQPGRHEAFPQTSAVGVVFQLSRRRVPVTTGSCSSYHGVVFQLSPVFIPRKWAAKPFCCASAALSFKKQYVRSIRRRVGVL